MPDRSKIHPFLAERLSVQTTDSTTTVPIIVRFRQGRASASNDVEGVQAATRVFRLIPATCNLATIQGIERLTDQADVDMVWYDAPVHTMVDVSVPMTGVAPMWEEGFTGKGIKVGIVDTGIDPKHPDFAMRIAQFKDLTSEGLFDINGHGTLIAGVVGGSGAASAGAYKGVAYDCSFYIAKAIRADGTGSTSDVMAGIDWAVQQGVQVLNLSPGSDLSSDGTDPLSAMCDAAVGAGIIVCVPAGNAGPAQGTLGCPASAKEVITAAATDKEDQMASFSSRGPTLDGRGKPDVSLPGMNIVSCRAGGTSVGTPLDEFYTQASGTSIAAAHATGACALLLQACPGLSPRQIKDALMNTARDLKSDPNAQGKGLVDVSAAVRSIAGEVRRPLKPTPAPLPPGCLGTLRSILGGR